MTAHICRNCRWWTPPGDDRDEDDFRIKHGCCAVTEMKDGQRQRDSKAIAGDGSDYYAILWTKPDFGCVQWEGKE